MDAGWAADGAEIGEDGVQLVRWRMDVVDAAAIGTAVDVHGNIHYKHPKVCDEADVV